MSIHYGDRVYLYMDDGRDYLLKIQEGKQFSTHRGNILHDEIAGKNYGENVLTTKGNRVYILPVGIIENIFHMKRSSQIVYPKDLGFILLMLDIKEGNRVIDVGLGSGSMSAAMARLVGSSGKVFAYDRREDMIALATLNLNDWNLIDRVVIQLRDIQNGFDVNEVDAIFLDVSQPWDYLKQCWEALKGGGRIGIISPTAGQVMEVLRCIKKIPFLQVEVWENMFRQFKPDPITFRPYDRMVAHTTYMMFARKVNELFTEESG